MKASDNPGGIFPTKTFLYSPLVGRTGLFKIFIILAFVAKGVLEKGIGPTGGIIPIF